MRLILQTPDLAEALARGDADRVPAGMDIGPVADLLRGMAAAQRHLYKITGADAPWLGYLAVDDATGQLVGACAFKGPVCDGAVEVTSMTFPPFQRQGHGVAMTRELIAIARAHPDVRTVIAHTLTAEGPSAQVLARLGFQRVGTRKNAEDGRVWTWELDCRADPPAEGG